MLNTLLPGFRAIKKFLHPDIQHLNISLRLKQADFLFFFSASFTTQAGEEEGVGTGISKLKMTLSRGDLNARFECRVETIAFEEPEISWVIVGVKGKLNCNYIL